MVVLGPEQVGSLDNRDDVIGDLGQLPAEDAPGRCSQTVPAIEAPAMGTIPGVLGEASSLTAGALVLGAVASLDLVRALRCRTEAERGIRHPTLRVR